MRIAVYPGSFDPITNGHLDVVRRAARVFDRVIVAVLENPRKSPLLDADGVAVIRAVVRPSPTWPIVEVQTFGGLTVTFCHEVGAGFLVRGLRAIADFDTELQLAHNNHQLAPDVDTVFFMTSLEHGYISSSLVKEIAQFGGDVSAMLPAAAVDPARGPRARVGDRPACHNRPSPAGASRAGRPSAGHHLSGRAPRVADRQRQAAAPDQNAIIDRDAALNLIDELRVAVPEEVRAAKRINSEGERIIEKAQEEAERIVARAQEQAAFLIEERGLTEAADAESRQIIAVAEDEAAGVRQGADEYAAGVLPASRQT